MPDAPGKPMMATASDLITYETNLGTEVYRILATLTCDDTAVPGLDPGAFTCNYVFENQSERTVGNILNPPGPIDFEDRLEVALDIQGADYAIADVRNLVGDWEYNGTIFSNRELTPTEETSFTVDFYFPPDAAVEANGPLTATMLVLSDGTANNEGLEGDVGVPFTFDPQARVELDKILLNDEVAAGGFALFELTATNYGPSDVRGASIADVLSGQLLGQPLVEPSQLTSFDLPAHDTATFVVSAQLPDTAPPNTTFGNDATLTAPGVTVLAGSTTAVNVTGTVGFRFLPPTDMSITKTIDVPGQIVPGQEVTFFLDVTNNGPQPAEDVLVSDLLYEIPQYAGATCTGPNDDWTSGGNLVRRLRQMPINTTERITCVYRVPPDAHQIAAATPVNAFFVAAANPEPDDAVARANNSGEIPVPLQAQSTLTIEKTLLNNPVPPDGTTFFEIAVCNNGPSDVAGLRLTDTPTLNLDTPAILSPDWTAPGGAYIPAGQCRDAVATSRVIDTATPGSTFTNMVAVDTSNVVAARGAGSSLDPIVNAPSDSASGTVGQFLPVVDLALTKSPTIVTAGGMGETVDLVLTNPASSTLAEGVVISELFPFPAVIESVTGPYVVDQGGTLVRTAPMIQGTVDNITIQFSVDSDVFPAGVYDNLAVVTADNPETNGANNVAMNTITVNRDVQLSIDKSDLVDPVRAGEVATYLIRVTNGGPSTVYPGEIDIIDGLQPVGFGIEYVGGSPECNPIIPICSIPPPGGQIEPGETYDLEMAFRLPDNFDPANGPLMNTVTATWTTNPPVMDSENTRVVPGSRADLNIIKFVKPDEQVAAGETFTYSIFVDNLGPQTATDIVVEDTMVSSGAYTVNSIANDLGGVCTPTSGGSTGVNNSFLFTCTLAALPIFDRWTITVIATADEPQDVNNTARVYMDDDLRPNIPVPQDPRPENNYAERALNVAGTADLTVSKTSVGEVRDAGCPIPPALPTASLTPDAVTAGLGITYTMVITNSGPSAAVDATLFDRLPPGIVVTGFSVTDAAGATVGSCTTGAAGSAVDPMICNLGDIDPTDSVTVVVNANVLADVPDATILENDVLVTSKTVDPNDGDNRATNLSTVEAQSDLSLVKDGTPSAVIAGEGLTYRLSVVNLGPSVANNVVISDTLDPDLTFVGFQVINGNGVCSVDTLNLATCQLNPIAPNGPPALPVVVEFFLRVKADATAGPLLNNAAVSSAGTDPCLANNTDDETTTVTQSADLAVFKRARNVAPVAGEQVTFEVVVRNNGPSEAQGVIVTDTVPAGLVYLDQNDNCALAAGLITCEVPVAAPGNNLDAGDTASFDLLFDVLPNVAQGAVITNTAWVTSTTPDTMLGNNRNDSVIFVRTEADLRVRKIGKPDDAVRAGDLLTYTIFVDNIGPSWAHGTFVTDEIVSSGFFDVVSIDPDVNSNRPTALCSLTSANDGALNVAVPNAGAGTPGAPLAGDVDERATVSCQLPDTPDPTPPFSIDDLEVFGGAFGGPNAGRWVVEIVVRANEAASINDIASATSLDIDPVAANNESAVEHAVTDVADLSVEKTALGEVRDLGCAVPPTASLVADRVTAGLGVTYSITVSNAGPSLAENTSLFDRLPPGIVVNGYTVVDGGGAPAGTCTTGTPGSAADPMVCDLGNLAVGEIRVVTVTADVGAGVADGTLLENDVVVSSRVFDDANANNRDTNLTLVGAAADLAIEKVGNPAAVVAGENVTYRISVRNLGPSVAPNVIVGDALDANLTYLGSQIIGGSGSCAVDTGNVVTCQLGNVAPNPAPAPPVVVELFLKVNNDAPAVVINNVATVASDVTDPCPTNNSDDADTTVTQGADLAITKATSDLTPVAGGEVTFSIDVVNNGPSDAQGVTVTDTVPAGLVYRNQNDFCVLAGTLLTCEVPLPAPDNVLAVGQRYNFDLVFDVLPDVTPDAIITNTATVQSTTPDAFGANNSDDSTIFIRTEADLRVRKFGKPDGEVRAGELLTYTIIVDNLGPSFSHGTVLTDEIVASGLFDVVQVDPDVNGNRPTAVCTLTSANDAGLNVAIPNGGAGSPAVPVAVDVNERGTLTCTMPDTPDPAGNPPFSVDDLETFGGPFGGPNAGRWIVELVLQAAEAQSINDVASVSSDDVDPDLSNNEAYVEHGISDVADLTVEKTAVGRVRDLGCAVPPTASDVPDRVTAGLDVTYTITVTNSGPSTAENVLLIDRLPPGIVVTGYTVADLAGAPAGNCDTGTPGSPLDKLTCGLGTMVDGDGRVITVQADVGADVRDGTILENDVLVLSDVFDIDNSDNYDSNLTLVDAQADMAIDKDDEPDAVVAGEELTYRLSVTNLGPSFAPNVVVRDQLNPNLTFLGFQVIGGPGVCNVDTGNLVTCQLGTVAPNPPPALPVVVELFMRVNPDAPAVPIANTATVTSGVADPCAANNSDDDTTDVGQNADLALLKSVDDLTPVAGGEVTFSIDVVNNGPSDAQSVTVTDPVPAGLAFRNQNDLCTLAGNLITCEVPLAAPNNTLEVGQSYSFDLVYDVLPDVTPGAIITNTATVQSATADLFLANNSDDSTIYIRTEADLRVRKFGKPDGAVRAGELLTYTIIVDNLGPSFSHATFMTDEIVASELFDVVAVDPDVNGNRPTAVCTLTSANDGALNVAIPNGGLGMPGAPIAVDVDERATLTCQMPDTPDPAGNPPFSTDDLETFGGPLQGPNAGRWILEVVVTARQTSSINNVASVSSADVDPDLSNNEAYAEHAITDVADLAIEKTALGEVADLVCPPLGGPAPFSLVADNVTAGLGATYTITVTNNGPSDAENVVVIDRLPPGVVVVDYSVVNAVGAPSGSCDTGTAGSAIDKLTCGLGLLKPGEQEFVTVVVEVNADVLAGTILENDVLVTSDIFDIDNDNNYDSNLMRVNAVADLAIQKDDDPDTVIAGEELEYTFTIRNNGPSFAQNVIISDTLHPDLIFLASTITGANGACNVDITNRLTCAIGTVAPNADPALPIVIRIRMLVDEDTLVTNIDNTVAITSDTDDPCLVDNTSMESTVVGQNADLRLLKSVSDLTPVAGEEVTFRIDVLNQGPSDAQNVVVTDAVPDGLIFRNQNDFCTETAGLITCEIPLAAPDNVLDNGERYAFDLVFDVDSDVAPGAIITNTAAVASSTNDPFLADNADDSTIYVRTVADLRVRKFGKPDGGVRAGELLTYTIIVDNLGPSFSHATYLTDEIVASELFDVVAVDPDVNGNRPTAVCTLTSANDGALNIAIPNGGSGAPGAHIANDIDERATLTCVIPDAPDTPGVAPYPRSTDDLETFGGPLQGGTSGRWIVEVVVTADQTSNINDVASTSSADTDPDLANNEAYVEHDITDVADLRVTKSALGQNHIGCGNLMAARPDEVTAGGVISYTIMVQNFGPSDAENVLIFDRLPAGIVVTDYSLVDEMGNATGDCETGTPGERSDRLVCGVGLLRSDNAAGVPGEKATLIVTATVNTGLLPGTILENDVFVDSDIFDIDNGNNYASNLTTVNTRADLAITKTNKGPNPVAAGESLVYQVDVVNLGKSVARGVIVTDTLPAGLFLQTSLGVRCNDVPGMAQVVECHLGDVRVNEQRTFFLTIGTEPFTVPSPDMMVTLFNRAEVDSRTIDPCPLNDVVQTATPVQRVSDVYVEKEALLDPVIAGEEASYRITFGNLGPSDAVLVSLTDTIPVGFTFNRCEPLDPNDSVDCRVISGDGVITPQVVRLQSLEMTNFDRFTNGGDLAAGAQMDFVLVADVSSGYVLDGRGDTAPGQGARAYGEATGYPHYANNLVVISSSKDPAPAVAYPFAAGAAPAAMGPAQVALPPIDRNNFDNEIVRVNSQADLAIHKTDIFGDPLLNPDNYFLMCDPVQPGGMITYTLSITNTGSSDAAEVIVEDWLDEIAVVHDPVQIDVEIINDDGLVDEIRDTGYIRVVTGRDRNFLNQRELGRINAGSSVKILIRVMVRQDAECGSDALNTARVRTRENALMWPPINGLPIGRTPTRDDNPTNNVDIEITDIECASLEVNKTISQDGTCPGRENAQLIPGAEVTFCYEITNTGTTYLDNIMVSDVLQTRSEPWGTEIFTATVRDAGDPKIPVPPGATLVLSTTVTKLDCECGDNTNNVTVKADAVNAGRTLLPCIDVEPKSDSATLFVACGGADRRLQLPILGPEECEPLLAIQNLGTEIARGMLVVWGDPGACPPQAAGPLKIECTGLIVPGSSWYYPASLLPQGARSGIMYSLNTTNVVDTPRGGQKSFDKLACESLFDLVVGNASEWEYFDENYRAGGTYLGPQDINGNQVVLDFEANVGEPLAVVVDRTCPDPADPARSVSAAYIGISTDYEGALNPVDGGYALHAPLVFASRADLNSLIQIHNSGTYCSSLELWLSDTDNCLRPVLGDVLALAPGETVTFDPNTVVGPDWLGSAFIRASQPLGVVVDTFGPSMFTSYRGVPADIDVADFTVGSFINYAPLTYSEYQGWDSAITVQNLSGVHAAKVKVYFLDRSGGIINTLVDWICPRGNQTFFLPLIDSIPGNWVGSARVESQEWFAWGSDLVEAPRIQSVVTLDKWIDPQRSERIEAVAYNALTEKLAFDWQIGSNKGGLTDGSAVIGLPIIAKGNRGITSEIAITNLVPKPGFTDFAIYLYDQNGLVDFYCQKLGDRQVEYIDLAQQGAIRDGYLGSAVISATFWEHHVWDNRGTHERNLVGLSAIVVERIGGTLLGPDIPGDESKAYEGVPIFTKFTPQRDVLCPGLPGPR